jgi:hypothetical protein
LKEQELMLLSLHLIELHLTIARHAGQHAAGGLELAGGVPNPGPQAPPGLSKPVNTVLAWGKWGVLVCGVAGLLICAGKMTIGQRNRATFAADGAAGVPWVLGGLSLAAIAAGVVGVFLR